LVNVWESLSLRIGYAKAVLVGVPGPAAVVTAPGGGEIKPQLLSLLLSRTGPIKQQAATSWNSRETDRIFSRINEKILTDKQLDRHLEKTRINRWDKRLDKLQGYIPGYRRKKT
jgi:hypothetical protein